MMNYFKFRHDLQKNYNHYVLKLFFHGLLLSSILFVASCSGSKKIQSAYQQKIRSVVATARTYTGTPYRWGGTNRKGMDCSGLLITSFRSAGLEIPRTSREQIRMGSPVKLKKLQPGDLVFFSARKSRRKVTHVGLVTEIRGSGNIQFIHASSSRGVIESNIYSTYYESRLITARRIF
jgi:probable lipoprotein NlpC